MEEEPVIIDTRVVRSSSSLESSPTETPEKVLKLNVTVGINFSDPAKDEKWKAEEEARRKNMKLNDLLVSENVALRQDRPEDINFAAKKDDTRGKKKSGNAAKLAWELLRVETLLLEIEGQFSSVGNIWYYSITDQIGFR